MTSHCAHCSEWTELTKHHIVPKAMRGGNEQSNLHWLCQRCHTEWHRIEQWTSLRSMGRAEVQAKYRQWFNHSDKFYAWAYRAIGKEVMKKHGYYRSVA